MKICVHTALFAIITVAFTLSCSDSGNGEAPDAGTMEAVVAEDVTAEQPHPGEAPYTANCAFCHDQVVYKAPSRLFVSMMGAQNILKAMNGGLMSEQAANISAQDRRAIAEYIAGQSLDNVAGSLPGGEIIGITPKIAP